MTTNSTRTKPASRTSLVAFGMVVTFALTGCATGPQTVAKLPSPSFAAPKVASAPPAPAPAPVTKGPVAIRSNPITQRPVRNVTGPKDWTPSVAPRPWKWVVVHHSATANGGAVAFDKMHKAKGWDGLGYDFVIGNGTDTADGQIEVGYRWRQQLTGAHAKTSDNKYNELGIGICLVGNFDIDRPTAEQLKSLNRLVAHLTKTYRIPLDTEHVKGHGDTKPTDCPGRYMNLAAVRSSVRQTLAADGFLVDDLAKVRPTTASGGELLTSSR